MFTLKYLPVEARAALNVGLAADLTVAFAGPQKTTWPVAVTGRECTRRIGRRRAPTSAAPRARQEESVRIIVA